MRRLIFFSTVLLAILLSIYHVHIGVHTDEAKYLLGIPYPHPPLFQFLLSSIDGWAFQEQFLRFIFAFVLLSGCWIVWQLVDARYSKARVILIISYIAIPAIVLWSGTVFMSLLTSLEFLLFLWLYDQSTKHRKAVWIPLVTGVLWLVTLSTALQGVLIAPLVAAILYRTLPKFQGALIFILPLCVFFIMLIANPLSLASFAVHPGHLFALQWKDFLGEALKIWLIGGGFLSIIGTFALLLRRDIPILLSFALLCAYILTSPQPYSAVLLVPFVIFGCTKIPSLIENYRKFFVCGVVGFSLVIISYYRLEIPMFSARSIIATLPVSVSTSTGTLVISGYFGHEWQYESSLPVRHFSKLALQDAVAVICMATCPSEILQSKKEWKQFLDTPLSIYIRSAYIP